MGALGGKGAARAVSYIHELRGFSRGVIVPRMLFAELANALTGTPASYIKAAGCIDRGEVGGLQPIRVGVLASYTAQLLAPYLKVEGAARGLAMAPWFAPYGQLEQAALDKNSPLYAHRPEIIVLLTRLEDVAAPLAIRFLTRTAAEIDEAIDSLKARLESLIAGVRRVSQAAVFIANFPQPSRKSAGLADAGLELSQAAAVSKANTMLAAISQKSANVCIFDFAHLVAAHGWNQWIDPKLLYMGRIPFGVAGQIATARSLARMMRAFVFPPLKCLALDLDNTLWGGILGEDGPGGIALGEEFPGNVYKGFQRYLLELKDRGILLAISSKNNEQETRELIATHPDMLLRLEDFAAMRINWREKSASLREIASELNIGLDALAFFDDNASERAEVLARLPEVTVIEAPAEPIGFIDAIEESGVFDRLKLSAEDRRRSEVYREQRERLKAGERFETQEDFLRGLEMKAIIGDVDALTLQRVAQLLTKTNQFNLTTRRHSPAEIEKMLQTGVGLWLRLVDRFGDNGITAVAIAVPENGAAWRIDTFLLSCRIISRGAETALLAKLIERIRDRGAAELFGEYAPTPKNEPCADFYPRHGFEPAGENRWRLDLTIQNVPSPDFITIEAP
jgi:FkbH-like protein